MSEWYWLIIAILCGAATFFAIRSSYWKGRYRQLLDDAFEKGCRAVLAEEAILDRPVCEWCRKGRPFVNDAHTHHQNIIPTDPPYPCAAWPAQIAFKQFKKP